MNDLPAPSSQRPASDSSQAVVQVSTARETAPSHPFPDDEQARLEIFRRALLSQTPRSIFTPLIILANVGVYAVMLFQGVDALWPDPAVMIDWGANHAPKTLNGEWWRLISSAFIHFGAIHLGMNMLALWNLGRFVERMFGNVGFLVLYFFAGVMGSLGSVHWHPLAISAGASGAIFGVAGALVGGTWKLRRTLPSSLLAGTRWVAINCLVLLVAFSFVPMVDNAAHVSGFLTGLACGLFLAEPIPNGGRSRRLLRNAVLAAVSVAVVLLAQQALPDPPTDFQELDNRFQRVQKQALRDVESAASRRQARAMTNEEYADLLESDVLPPWREVGDDLEAAKLVPKVHQRRVNDLLQLIRLRQRGWEREIEALRENNPLKQAEAEQLQQQANAFIQRLDSQAEPTD